MKVQVSSNFSKENLKRNLQVKKMKSPSSMRNGRLNTSKCRDKHQKMGVLYIHALKMPSLNYLITPKKRNKVLFYFLNQKNWKRGPTRSLSNCGPQPVGNRWSPPSIEPHFLYSCLPVFLPHVVNSSSLAPAHGYPVQTSPKNFKHP
jgi:hypothetical protein